MAYYSETDKIREILNPKYLEGKVIDIGCGDHKIKPDAIGVDGRKLDGVDVILPDSGCIYELASYIQLMDSDCVFSSHCLEHLQDDYLALLNWSKLIKKGGYIILYLPESEWYNSYQNLEHTRNYNYKDFIFFFKRNFCGEGMNYNGEHFEKLFEFVEGGLHQGFDKYSFYLVAQKL